MSNLLQIFTARYFGCAPLLLIIGVLCTSCYTISQGFTMLGYLNRAVPLDKIDDTEFASLVADIRVFAVEELGLKESRNYTRYVELDRNYLAAIVSASAKDSFHRHEWRFPVVGSMPYKGFFNIDGARKERSKLEKKDLDIWIRTTDAFSTLGWFRDPLYSYMRNYSPARLADLIIHELVHSTVFIKGRMNFNEEIAEFIGTEGSRLFIKSRYGIDSKEYRDMDANDANNKNFVLFIQGLIAELDVLYSGAQSREEKLAEKELIIKAAKKRYEAEYEKLFTNDNYRYFIELPVNNAYLELFRLYHAEDNFYGGLFERAGKDLKTFIAAAKKITKKGDPRTQLEEALFP